MKNFGASLVALSFAAVAIISSLSLNSCKQKSVTEWDTVTRQHWDTMYVHDTIHCPDDSSTWISSNANTTETLVIGSFVGNSGFVGGSHGVMLQTADAGNTWSAIASAPVFNSSYGPGVVYGLDFAGSNLFAAGEQRMIVRWDNGNWDAMNTDAIPTSDLIRSLHFVDAMNGFIGTSDAYGAASGTICATSDGGQTWAPVFTTHGGIYTIAFNGPIGVAQGRFGVSYWTNDNGASWHPGSSDVPSALISRSVLTSSTTGFAVASADANTGYILQTNDAGHTWHTLKIVPYGLQGIASNGNGRITAVGYGGVMVESVDGGATWARTNLGTSRWIDVRYLNSSRAVIVGENGRIYTRDK